MVLLSKFLPMPKIVLYRIAVFLLVSFITSQAAAQQLLPIGQKAYADSLGVVVRSKASDSLKAGAYYLLSDYYRVSDSVKSKYYLSHGKTSATNYPYLKAIYNFYQGQYYSTRSKAKAARSFQMTQKQLAAFKGKDALLMRAAAWYNYAIALKDSKGYPYVMEVLTKQAIPLARQSGNVEKLAHYYSQFGTILMYNAQFDKAALYNKKAIDLLEKDIPQSPTLLLAYIAAANNFIYAGKKDAAKEMLYAAKKILSLSPDCVSYPLYYLCEAQYNIYIENFDGAIKSAKLGIGLAKSLNQPDILQLLYFRNYESLLHLKRYKQAKMQLMAILHEGIFTKDVNNRKTIFAQLVSINELLADESEAYKWLKKYSALNDSLSDSRLKETVSTLEAKYQNSENRNQIVQLKTQKVQQDLEVTEQKNYVFALAGISLLFFSIALFSYLYYRSNKKLILQKELNHKQEIETRQQEEKLKITRAILEGEEKERERIAKELHDGLGGMLAGVKINLSGWASKQLAQDQRFEFDTIVHQLDRSVSELRGVARNLMPESLLKFGLETALKDLCEFFMNDDLDIDLQTYSIAKDLSLSAQLNIYRIVQELLSNVIRHAKATTILLQCSQDAAAFFITIEDNGIGFAVEDLSNRAGMGINNIHNRVEYLGGTVEIDSKIGEGTTVNIELKLHGK